jgi:transcriptional regulator with XRE-family HTH domain
VHALGTYLAEQMEARGWTAAELARRSGVTKQTLYNLLDPERTTLGRMLEDRTYSGLAAALNVPAEVLVMKAAEAMGIPVPPPGRSDPAAVVDHPASTLEQLVAFMDGDHLPEEVLLDYLKRVMVLADRITDIVLEFRPGGRGGGARG